MGLDCYWEPPKEDAPEVVFDPPLELCGGLYSEHGQGSFRGKVYARVVMDLTGVSLYQEEIPNTVVMEMAAKLRAAAEARPAGWDEDCVRDLARMFTAYGAAGWSLQGWW